MKKLNSIWIGAIAALATILVGCTLYLDEPEPIPEEEKGVGSEYHEKNDTVDVTYQFNDGVKILSRRLQDAYLAQVQDSVLYFYDTMPVEERPVVGEGLYSENTVQIPLGLCNTVLSVTNENGLIKVVTQPADLGKIFKKLVLNIDRYVDIEKGYIVDSVPDVDSSLISSPEARQEFLDYRARRDRDWTTRAEESDGADDVDEESSWGVSFDTRKITKESAKVAEGVSGLAEMMDLPLIPEKVRSKLNKVAKAPKKFKISPSFLKNSSAEVKWYAKGDISRKHTNHVSIVIDSDNDYVKFVNEEETTWEVGVEVGVNAGPKINDETFQPGKILLDKTLYKSKPSLKLEQDVEGPDVVIPVWGPLSIILETSFTVCFEVEACGKIVVKRVTRKVTGTEVRNGKPKNIDDEGTKSSTSVKEASISGSAKLELEFSAGIGLRIGKGLTIDVTLNGFIQGGAQVKAYKNFVEESEDNVLQVTHDNYLRFYVNIGLSLGIRIKAFFFTAYDNKFKLKSWPLVDEKYTFYPQIDTKYSNVKLDEEAEEFKDGPGGEVQVEEGFWYTQKFSKMGLFASIGSYDKMKPFIKVYEGRHGKKQIGENIYCEEAMASDYTTYTLSSSTDKEYKYHITGLKDEEVYRLVPCIDYDGVILEYKNDAEYFSSIKPYIALADIDTTPAVEQLYGNNEGWSINPYRYFIVCYPNVYGSAFIKKWGLHIKVFNSKGKAILNKRFPVSATGWHLYTIGLNMYTSVKNPKVEIRPYAYVYKDATESELRYYDKEKHTLTLSDSKGVISDIEGIETVIKVDSQ